MDRRPLSGSLSVSGTMNVTALSVFSVSGDCKRALLFSLAGKDFKRLPFASFDFIVASRRFISPSVQGSGRAIEMRPKPSGADRFIVVFRLMLPSCLWSAAIRMNLQDFIFRIPDSPIRCRSEAISGTFRHVPDNLRRSA